MKRFNDLYEQDLLDEFKKVSMDCKSPEKKLKNNFEININEGRNINLFEKPTDLDEISIVKRINSKRALYF